MQFGDFLFKKLGGGAIAEDFAGHGIDGRSGPVTIFLCDAGHTTAFGKIAADDTVIPLIRATFARRKGMTIVDRQASVSSLVMLHAVTILKLRTIVHGDRLERTLREF